MHTEDLADDLAAAVRSPDIFAVYQPQVSLESGSIVAAEALCRWRHPRLGEVDPRTAIDVAERSGVIHELGRRMLDECLDTLMGWRAMGRGWAVTVNVSPVQFEDASFAGQVATQVERRATEPGSLILELARGIPSNSEAAVSAQLNMLRGLGVEISLGDYGEGTIAPEQLARLSLSEVKIPGHLVRAAEPGARAALRREVDTAHAHGLRVVAEGIETLTHLDIAVELGCDRAQGFLIREPDAEIVFP